MALVNKDDYKTKVISGLSRNRSKSEGAKTTGVYGGFGLPDTKITRRGRAPCKQISFSSPSQNFSNT
jgi:hypothetical protein